MGPPDNRDLLAVCLWAAATAVAVAVSDNALLRAVLGVPSLLFVMGHPLLRAFGVRTRSALEHLIYAVGASLAVAVAGGFALNFMGLLTPSGWAGWICVVTTGASLVAAARRDAPDLPPWPRLPGFRLRHVAALALAASFATAAYALAVRDEARQQQFKYTEFWILPSTDGGGLTVGVKSAEARPQRFDLEISLDGRPFAVFRPLTIAPGQLWTREVPIPYRTVSQKAVARLYRLKDKRLYRRVSVLVPAS
ncbi:MAG: hypothetical protein ACREDC_05570 [Bradyrhizobium sp.]